MNKIMFISEIKANMQFYNLYFFLIGTFIKLEIKDDVRAGDVAQCPGAWLAYVQPWVPCPVLGKSKGGR